MEHAKRGEAQSEIPDNDPSQGLENVVRRTTGLRLREQDVAALTHWTAQRVCTLSLPTMAHYSTLLTENSAAGRLERELLTVQFTTGETYFFRDQGQFDLLAQTILPELIERRADQCRLRLWSAGCAAGEEAYSLAMLVTELAPRLVGWRVQIEGTDIDSTALEKARQGNYRSWSFRTLDAQRKQRYFQAHGDQWQINPDLRAMVHFHCVDLVHDPLPDLQAGLSEVDLILCRNVFIYLNTAAVSRVTAKLTQALATGGYLVTGHSELFGHDLAPLRVRLFAQSAVFQKTPVPLVETGLGVVLAKVPVPAIAALLPVLGIELPSRHTPTATTAPDSDHLMQAAWHHADRGRPVEAKQDCDKALALSAFDPRPYYLLAQLAQERGDATEARSLLNKVIYLDPTFIAAYLELGTLLAQAGDHARARRTYEIVRTALSKLPTQTRIEPYSESSASDVIAYVDRLLSAFGAPTVA